jgi:hypothetical protein
MKSNKLLLIKVSMSLKNSFSMNLVMKLYNNFLEAFNKQTLIS